MVSKNKDLTVIVFKNVFKKLAETSVTKRRQRLLRRMEENRLLLNMELKEDGKLESSGTLRNSATTEANIAKLLAKKQNERTKTY